MYSGKRVVCIIPARGGSKGIPGKNIKELAGKPLIAYSIEQALAAKCIDRVLVSTDDDAIAELSRQWGAEVPFRRPAHLADDNAGIIDVLLHVVDWLERNDNYSFDILVLLHATAPFRTAEDIENCVRLLMESEADNVFSVTEAHRNPYFNMVELNERGEVELSKKGAFLTRQSAPKVYDMNASIYVWWNSILKKEKKLFLSGSRIYVMPKERSIDIDDTFDFFVAELVKTADRKRMA